MIKRALEVAGLLVVVVALLLGVGHALQRGWIHDLLPRPEVAAPVSLGIVGPAETIAGGENYFLAEVTGETGAVVWDVSPKSPGALSVVAGGNAVRFQSNEPGRFVITAFVAGAAKVGASAHIEFVNVVLEDAPADDVEPDPPHVEPMPTGPVGPPAPPPSTVEGLVERALADVPSADKVAEAKLLAGVVKQLIARIRSGLVAPDADVTLELEEQLELTLGEKARAWGIFVAEIRSIYGDLRAQGDVTTAATAVGMLEALAAVLARAH